MSDSGHLVCLMKLHSSFVYNTGHLVKQFPLSNAVFVLQVCCSFSKVPQCAPGKSWWLPTATLQAYNRGKFLQILVPQFFLFIVTFVNIFLSDIVNSP